MNLHFFIPGDINTLTGGYIYDKRIIDGLCANGHVVHVHGLSDDFPFPSEVSKKQCRKGIDAIPIGEVMIFDSLAFGAIPELLKSARPDHPIIALAHLPLSVGIGFTIDQKNKLSILENEAFTYADLVVVTSNYTKDLLKENGVNHDLIKVIIPGVEVFLHKKIYSQIPRKLITVSNYTRNKGHQYLIKSLIEIKNNDWRLDCYGNMNFDPEYVKELSYLIKDNKLTEKIFLHSSISGNELSEAYVNSDLLIHPSNFESYGMVLAEALAHGIPVVASTGGAIVQTVPKSMGLFFNANDNNSLLETIKQALTDSNLYKNLGTNASEYINQAQTWEKSVLDFENALKNLLK